MIEPGFSSILASSAARTINVILSYYYRRYHIIIIFNIILLSSSISCYHHHQYHIITAAMRTTIRRVQRGAIPSVLHDAEQTHRTAETRTRRRLEMTASQQPPRPRAGDQGPGRGAHSDNQMLCCSNQINQNNYVHPHIRLTRR